MQKVNLLVIGINNIVVLLLLFGGGMMMGGWGYRGWSMMGPGGMMNNWEYATSPFPLGWIGMIFMWLVPVGLIVLAALGIVWLVQNGGNSKPLFSYEPGNKIISKVLLAVSVTLLLAACVSQPRGGTAWGVGAFDSNGERIYFTATSERGANITYTGGPASGMMMGSGYLTCASCHGPDGRGGVHSMMGMQTMNAPDIRWEVLAGEVKGDHGGESEDGHGSGEYNLETFRLAVKEGKHPDGTKSLSTNMPRWKISDDDLADLIAYIKTLP